MKHSSFYAFLVLFDVLSRLRICPAYTWLTPNPSHKAGSNNRRSLKLDAISRRSFLGQTLLIPVTAVITFSAREEASASPPSTIKSANWDDSNKHGFELERMADAINDGLKETQWFVTGVGRPEFFSDDFRFTDATTKQSMSGFKKYCQFIRQRYAETAARCDLIDCSATSPNTISALWRLSGLEPKSPMVILSVLNTGPDGLIREQVDNLMQTNAPSLQELQSKWPLDCLQQPVHSGL